ncbi:TolB-like translocation protein [Seonamhaeicola maritimus]|uniref:Exo-alpha-sialidase n=1 Tax=Seonamhaeicola maritimus TaxID=2591822 RepID=A0A5C7GJR6_9FLAO|nr:PD40 domain-containing protein [Seonamhaeicola maritimus]TXG38726.1 exo-alpha-sialidase [Seonamhaeicola maritimus]
MTLFFKRLKRVYLQLTTLILIILLACSCKKQESQKSSIDFEISPDSLEVLFPNEISSHLTQRDFALSPDKNEVIYTLGDQKETKRVLVSMIRENGIWSKKTMLPFCGSYQDIEPSFSPYGSYLFFASTRPIYGDSTRTDYNIWVSKKENNVWQDPIALDSTINSKGQEYFPSVTNSGNIYFTASRPEGLGLEDIYVSEFKNETYQNPKVLDSTINSKSYEFNAFVNPDENLIIYSSYGRPDGLGGGDLYYSTKNSKGHWNPAKNFGEPINSDKLDFCPFYYAQTGTLYFSSLRTHYPDTIKSVEEFISLAEQPGNGLSSIYRITAKDILE